MHCGREEEKDVVVGIVVLLPTKKCFFAEYTYIALMQCLAYPVIMAIEENITILLCLV